MAKKTTPTPANETESAEPMTIAPAAAPATDEQGGMTAQATEALADAAAVQEQPEKAEAEEESAQAEEAAQVAKTAAPTEIQAPEDDAQAEDASDASDEAATADEADDIEPLETLDSLALRYRVPSWKQAAMLQMQGWAPGKCVSAADYETALADLGTRPLGSGARR